MANPRSLVIVASSSPQYVNNTGELHDRATGAVASTAEDRALFWESGTRSALSPIAAAKSPVLLVHSIPDPSAPKEDWGAAQCPAVEVLLERRPSQPPAHADMERRQAPARAAELAAIQSLNGVVGIDFTDDLCSPSRCNTYADGRLLYRDGTHLSPDGARLLTDRFTQLIEENARPS